MYPDTANDFVDPFGQPVDAVVHQRIIIEPAFLIGLLVLILIALFVWGLAGFLGRDKARHQVIKSKEESATNIYDAIAYHIDEALQAPGGTMLEKAKDLKAAIDARLGSVIALNSRPGKILKALSDALKPAPTAEELAEKAEKDKAKAKKVKVAMSSEEHRIAVWNALHKFKGVWSEKAVIMNLIFDAQEELTRPHAKAYVEELKREYDKDFGHGKPESHRHRKPERVKNPRAALKAAIADLDPNDPPSPPVAPAPKGKGRKLAKHKKNMLA